MVEGSFLSIFLNCLLVCLVCYDSNQQMLMRVSAFRLHSFFTCDYLTCVDKCNVSLSRESISMFLGWQIVSCRVFVYVCVLNLICGSLCSKGRRRYIWSPDDTSFPLNVCSGFDMRHHIPQGLMSVMLILTLLELCISISVSAMWCVKSSRNSTEVGQFPSLIIHMDCQGLRFSLSPRIGKTKSCSNDLWGSQSQRWCEYVGWNQGWKNEETVYFL